MTRLRTALILALGFMAPALGLHAQQKPQPEWVIESLRGEGGAVYDFQTGIATATNVLVKYGGAALTAERVAVNQTSGEVIADGNVRIQQGEQLWVSEHVLYNFKTGQVEAHQFRTGQTPVFVSGQGLHGDLTNRLYVATNAVMTTDDVAKPAFTVHASRIKIIPGKRIQAYDAVLYVGKVPVFYLPYYSRDLGERANNFTFTPGYRTSYGAFILGSYRWYWGEDLDGILHVDYRGERGPGAGPDVNYDYGKWGKGTLKYYYTYDKDPEYDELGVPISNNRQRVWFSYQANPATNFYLKSMVRYQSDLAVVRDFFEAEYHQDQQPDTYFEANKFWRNFSVDAYVQPRVNTFLQNVERLPDIQLTGYRQQLGSSPFYYESQSSFGYYEQAYAVNGGIYGPPPGTNYAGARADTFQQILLPQTFFGWLNVTPRAGGRLTYYSEANGPYAMTNEQYRAVFNTGAELTFKASRVWPSVQSDTLELNGLRHIIQPAFNYVYIPEPSAAPAQLPQYDYQFPSLRLLPIDFPDYNSIDQIESQNVIRLGLRNKLQTRRQNAVANVLNWDVYIDWNIVPNPNQTRFSDLYSDLSLKPRSWLTLESLIRYEIDTLQWRMSYTTLTIQPNDLWSWRIGHYYLRDDPSTSPTSLGPGNNVLNNAFYYRFNEEWGFRTAHYYNIQTGKLQQQSFTLYKDMRSWTAGLTFLVQTSTGGSPDYTAAFTFSLKAFPRYGLGGDSAGPYSLLGG